MLDDDTLISVPDISFAFSVWKVMSIINLKNLTADFSRQTLSCFTVGFHSNFQTRLLGLYRGNMSQRQQECTAMAALSCRIQKQQEVTCRLFVFGGFCPHTLHVIWACTTKHARHTQDVCCLCDFTYFYISVHQYTSVFNFKHISERITIMSYYKE